jgi:hypothetical protein
MISDMVTELRTLAVEGSEALTRGENHDSRLDTRPKMRNGLDAHEAGEELAGNIALLRLSGPLDETGAVTWLCQGWVGMSGLKAYQKTREHPDKFILRRAGREKDTPAVDIGPLLGKAQQEIVDYLDFPPNPKAHCSEPPLLNALANLLKSGALKARKDPELFLLTERLPCASCVAFLASFRKSHPTIRLHLLYLFDYTDRVERRLALDMKGLADSVHLLQYLSELDQGHEASKAWGSHLGCTLKGPSLNVMHVTELQTGLALVASNGLSVTARASGAPSAQFISRMPSTTAGYQSISIPPKSK